MENEKREEARAEAWKNSASNYKQADGFLFTKNGLPNIQPVFHEAFDSGYQSGLEANAWVSVEDGLPAVGETRLWQSKGGETPMVGYLNGERDRVMRSGGSSYEWLRAFVAHRPLPAPFTPPSGQGEWKECPDCTHSFRSSEEHFCQTPRVKQAELPPHDETEVPPDYNGFQEYRNTHCPRCDGPPTICGDGCTRRCPKCDVKWCACPSSACVKEYYALQEAKQENDNEPDTR